jgi:hypothetical protein
LKRNGQSGENVYAQLLLAIFRHHWRKGMSSFPFKREELEHFAEHLNIRLPKNLGDVLYSFRYRVPLPREIGTKAPKGYEWIIEGAGRGCYEMKLIKKSLVVPRVDLVATKIPDATPEITSMYALNDEQALLAKVRYNRLIDIFLGITAYSLQNHLRTTVPGVGQIEIDEVYVAVDKQGVHYVVPVQAKGGSDRHSVVQTKQDIQCCLLKFPNLVCRSVSAQFMDDGIIAMFELTLENDDVRVVQERHYRLVASEALTLDELRSYRLHRSPTDL